MSEYVLSDYTIVADIEVDGTERDDLWCSAAQIRYPDENDEPAYADADDECCDMITAELPDVLLELWLEKKQCEAENRLDAMKEEGLY